MKSLYPTLGDLSISHKLNKMRQKGHMLYKIERLIDWSKISALLSKVDYPKTINGGSDAYSSMLIFRMLLIKKYYGLSTRQLEEHVYCNIVFMDFCCAGLDTDIPDHSTLCRWEERFRKNNIFRDAFNEINNQLNQKGIKIKDGMILDASIIESYSRPKKVTVIEEIPAVIEQSKLTETYNQESNEDKETSHGSSENKSDFQEIETSQKKYTVKTTYSSDPASNWGFQNGFKFGLKSHTSVNRTGYVNGYFFTQANVNEVTCVEQMINIVKPAAGTYSSGDKDYESEKNDKLLEKYKLNNQIMKKQKDKNNPDPLIIEKNKLISKSRFVVERTIGTIKHGLGMGRARYKGIEKNENDWGLSCIVHNLIRGANELFNIKTLNLLPNT